MSASLGTVSPLSVEAFSGFVYPETLQKLALLDDGTTETGNEVLQNSGMGFSEAAISGTLTSSSDVTALEGYQADKSTNTFTEPDGATTHSVVLASLQIANIFPSVWTYSATLIDVGS